MTILSIGEAGISAVKEKSKVLTELSDNTLGILLVLPLVVLLVGLFIIPFAFAVWLSFHNVTPFLTNPEFVGLENYWSIFESPLFYATFWRSILYTITSVAISLMIGILFALVLNRGFRAKRWITGIVLSPYLMPLVGAVILFQWSFNGLTGVANYLLMEIGLISQPIAFFSTSEWAFNILVGMTSWRLFPFVTILVLAKLQTIPSSHYENARILGAGRWRTFRSVTLPQIKNVIYLSILFRVLWVFNLFDIVWLSTRGGPGDATEILPTLVYRTAFLQQNMGRAAAIGVIMSIVLVLWIFTWHRTLGSDGRGRVSRFVGRSLRRVKQAIGNGWFGPSPHKNLIGSTTSPRALLPSFPELSITQRRRLERLLTIVGVSFTLAFVVGPVLWGVLSSFRPPAEVIQWPPQLLSTSFSLENYLQLMRQEDVMLYITNSLITAAYAVIINLCIAIPTAYALSRMDFRGKALVTNWNVIIYAFPYMLLGIPFFLIFRQIGILNTNLGLALPHAGFALPLSILLLNVFFSDIQDELLENARTMGASRLYAIRKIILPLSLPGIAACAIFTAVYSWKDYTFALIILQTRENYTVPLWVANILQGEALTAWGTALAAGMVVTIPPVLVIFWLQKYLIKGFATSY